MPDRDPLQHLHDAWQQLDSPPAARTFSEEDDITRDAVDWASAAWQKIEVPAVRLPRPKASFRFYKQALAAAAVLLLSTLMLLHEPTTGDPQDSHKVVQISPSTPAIVAPDAAPAAPIAISPRLIASTDEKVEILSGTVRLTMLRGPSSSAKTITD
jgi:hypothetical protein